MGRTNERSKLKRFIHACLHDRIVSLVMDILLLILLCIYIYNGVYELPYFFAGLFILRNLIIIICLFLLRRKGRKIQSQKTKEV